MTGPATRAAVLTAVGLFACLQPRSAQAIPAFARKYGTACSTCHAGGPPRLNPFGEAFFLNGFEMPSGAERELRRREEVPLGAPERTALFPDTTWPGELPEAVPLALAAWQELSVELGDGAPRVSFDVPTELVLLAGGTLGWHIGFFAEYTLAAADEGPGLGELVLVASRPLGTLLPAGHLTIRAGQFAPMFLRESTGLATSYRVGLSPYRLSDQQSGIEVYGRPFRRLLWYAGVTNGETAFEDPSRGKDYYAGLELKLGGIGLRIDEGPTSNPKPWRDDSVVIAVAGYTGRHAVVDERVDPPRTFHDRLWRGVGRLRVRVWDVDLGGAVVVGLDEDPSGTGGSARSVAWSANAWWLAYPWLQFSVRYGEVRVQHEDKQAALRALARAYLRLNVSLQLQANVPISSDSDPSVGAELFFAF